MAFTEQEQKVAATLKLDYGSHDGEFKTSIEGGANLLDGWMKVEHWDRKVCVMEFVNFIRHGVVDDDPPCVSKVIRNICIERNDEGTTKGILPALKRIAPEVIHTAPTRMSARGDRVLRDISNKEFKAAESERREMVGEFKKHWELTHKDNPEFADGELFNFAMPSVREFNAFLRKLIAVGKFEPVPDAGGSGCGPAGCAVDPVERGDGLGHIGSS